MHNEIKELGGIFNKKSGFLIAQQYCLACGHDLHTYKCFKIFLRKINYTETKEEKISLKHLKIENEHFVEKDILLLKIVSEKEIYYFQKKLKDIQKISFTKANLEKNFEKVVKKIMEN